MLNPEDRRAIEGLFDRLAEAERRSPDRDRDAEELIRAEVSRLPSAPYYMAQTIVVQQQGLEAAEARIKELEGQVAQRDQQRQRSPWDRGDDNYDQRYQRGGYGGGFGGGGFLGGAMQTALGVAGGVLLGNAIGSLLGGGEAHAAESNQNEDAQSDQDHDQADQDQDRDRDQGNFGNDNEGDTGGFDDGGGFDMGGDF